MQDFVRQFMKNKAKFSYEDHCYWFERIIKSSTDLYFVFEVDKKPYGLICINGWNKKLNEAEWGFYMGESKRPSKSSLLMAYLFLNHCFFVGKFNRILAEVQKENISSIKYHSLPGFKSYREENGYISYQLTKTDWIHMRNGLEIQLKNVGYEL